MKLPKTLNRVELRKYKVKLRCELCNGIHLINKKYRKVGHYIEVQQSGFTKDLGVCDNCNGTGYEIIPLLSSYTDNEDVLCIFRK